MRELMEFLRVYGIMLFCTLTVTAMAIIMINCAQRMKALEKRMEAMENSVREALAGANNENRLDNLKRQKIITENMANFSESMTRAILSINDENAADSNR